MVKRLIIVIIALLPYAPAAASDKPRAFQDYTTANELFAAARFREALSLYKNVLVSPPKGVSPSEIHTRIGDSYFRLGFSRNALDAYRAALPGQKDSLRPETQYWIGFCCFLLGRDAEAVKEFLKIPQLYPASGIWIGTAYYWAGRASERMGKREEAAAYYRKAGGSGRSTQGKFALKKAEAVKRKQAKNDGR